MSSKAIINIRQLVAINESKHPLRGKALEEISCIEDAYVIIEGDEIASFGAMAGFNAVGLGMPDEVIDASGKLVLPAWCDSHTHLVFAGSREGEFVDKIRGASYADINAKGGGILRTASMIADASEDELFAIGWSRLQEIAKLGTGAVEIKSGYGLTIDGELKMLRTIKKLKSKSSLTIKSTFLGAHSYPLEYRQNHQGYIDLVIHQMLPIIAAEQLADYVDVFCEEGFFSPLEMKIICDAAAGYGLKPKLHVNQLNSIGGIEMAKALNAVSADHLEIMTENDILNIASADTIATLLPGAAFFLRMAMPAARSLINAGAAIALATDFNPGSAPSGNMNTVIALACIQMKMLPQEAINAATLNGAFAMEVADKLGSIAQGKVANLIITKPVPSIAYLPYSFGENLIDKVIINGEFLA